MTNRPKDAHISDSASGGTEETMASEIRLRERADKIVRNYSAPIDIESGVLALNIFLALSEVSRPSDAPAQSSEARPGVGNVVESNTADEKGLASRVEELEAALREIYECGSISYAEIVANRVLAQPSGNTPGQKS